jgi:hypothetical protein
LGFAVALHRTLHEARAALRSRRVVAITSSTSPSRSTARQR